MGLKIEDTIRGQLRNCNDFHFLLVNNMSKLMTGKVNNCQSSDFHVSGLKWRLFICQSAGLKDHLSFYLWVTDDKCIGSNLEVRCNCKLSVVAHTGQDKRNSFVGCHNEKNTLYGLKDFISYKELKERFLVNDEAVFCAEVTNVQPSFFITSIPRPKGTAERIKLMDIPRNNCRFTWKITQFSSFTGDRHSSYEFTVGQRDGGEFGHTQFQLEQFGKLVMYPNGNKEGKGNSLSLYLHATDYVTNCPKGKTLAVFKLRALDQLHRNHYEASYEYWFAYDPTEKESTLGAHKWLSLEELHKPSRGFLMNDHIYLSVEFLIVSISESIYGDNI